MTAKEKREIAKLTAEYLMELQDEMLPLAKVVEMFGFSESFIYHNAKELGGVKAASKWFFSKNNLNKLIKYGKIPCRAIPCKA